MATYGKGAPKSNVSQKFRDQMMALAAYADAAAKAVQGEGASQWFVPAGYDGGLFDLEAMHEPFSRSDHENDFIAATKDPNSPGTLGDLYLTQIQGDTLACMERAYRARHQSSVRNRMHAAARLRGHGHPSGVLAGGLLHYVVSLDAHNKGEPV